MSPPRNRLESVYSRLKNNTEEGEAHLASDPARDKSQTLSRPHSARVGGLAKKNCLAEMWSGSEEGSNSRLIDCSFTQP